MKEVWIFNGTGASFPSGVFTKKEGALKWIRAHELSGCLTLYPIDIPIYEWAIKNEHFNPKNDAQRDPIFIQKFSSGYLEHDHFENGK